MFSKVFFFQNFNIIEKYHSLIIAVEHDPYEILEYLSPFLYSSSSIIIYHPYREPLAECYMKMKLNYGQYIDISMFETWFREYQVLKNRTHPHNFMNAQSGFILKAKKLFVS